MSEKLPTTIRLCFKRDGSEYQILDADGPAAVSVTAREFICPPINNELVARIASLCKGVSRLALELEDAEELDGLPWELLADPNSAGGLSLLRQVPAPDPLRDLALAAPLRVLAIIVSPSDLPPFDVNREWELLEEAFQPLTASGQALIERLEEGTEIGLQAALARKPFHVLHFVGYGRSNLTARYGSLLFEAQGGSSRAITAQHLAGLLGQHIDIRLTVLDLGKKVEGLSPFAETARAFVRGGVSSVVAMRRRLSAQAAKGFYRELYLSLASGLPVDQSVMAARNVLAKVSREIEWDIPMLYGADWDKALLKIESSGKDLRITRDVVTANTPAPTLPESNVQDSSVSTSDSGLDEPERKIDQVGIQKGIMPRWRPRKGVRILILAASPDNLAVLRVNEELREIDDGLRRAKYRQRFRLEQRMAVRPLDLQQAMLEVDPQIVHFCGHGSGVEGLIFEDRNGHSRPVSGLALANLFKLFSGKLECVVLNSCHSEEQAKVISKYIPYVIGMKRQIGDRAAITFSIGFYGALGAGQSVEFAFQMGRSAIELENLPDDLMPVLLVGPGNIG